MRFLSRSLFLKRWGGVGDDDDDDDDDDEIVRVTFQLSRSSNEVLVSRLQRY